MLKNELLHPQILSALAQAGHGSRILISDGNYPHWTKRGPNAQVVFLNLAPGMVKVTDVLKVLTGAVPIESVAIMDYRRQGAHALAEDPPIWNEFRKILADAKVSVEMTKIEQSAFYEAGGTKDVCLTVATGDQRVYANVLLTIGVVR